MTILYILTGWLLLQVAVVWFAVTHSTARGKIGAFEA